jgi:hypothetical protein
MLLILGLVGIGGYLFLKSQSGTSGQTDSQRAALLAWESGSGDDAYWRQVISQMSDAEINATYQYVFNYILKGTRPPAGSDLYNQIMAIGSKYNIFT